MNFGPRVTSVHGVACGDRSETETVPAQEEFIEQAAPFRAELIAHCYRMLGSVHDAEDLVQETYLRGWRGYQAFEERAALRTWLYRIATTACLRALENRARRVLPAGVGAPVTARSTRTPASTDGAAVHEWLEPIPDDLTVRDPRSSLHRKAKRPAGGDDGTAGASGAAASRVDPARRRAVQRRRGRRTSGNHARRGQQLTAARPRSSRRGRAHRGRRMASPTTPSAGNCSTATARHSKTRTWRPSPNCCKPTSSSKCRLCQCGSPAETRCMRFLAARAFTKSGDIVMIPTAANGTTRRRRVPPHRRRRHAGPFDPRPHRRAAQRDRCDHRLSRSGACSAPSACRRPGKLRVAPGMRLELHHVASSCGPVWTGPRAARRIRRGRRS